MEEKKKEKESQDKAVQLTAISMFNIHTVLTRFKDDIWNYPSEKNTRKKQFNSVLKWLHTINALQPMNMTDNMDVLQNQLQLPDMDWSQLCTGHHGFAETTYSRTSE